MPAKQEIKEWFHRGLSDKQIKDELIKTGTDERYIVDLLNEVSKMRHSKRVANALIYIMLGALFCLLSCIITLLSDSSSPLILYGFKTIGIVIIFIGLYKVFN